MRWGVGILAAIMLGCVSGDDTSGKPQGSLGGPCFANNTCNTGLACVLENGVGVCEQPDATVEDAPVDQSASDAPVEAATDAGVDAPAEAAVEAGCDASAAVTTACDNCGNQACCPKDGTCYGTEATCEPACSNMPCFDCTGAGTCGSNYCCAVNAATQPTCPVTVAIGSGTVCMANCPGVVICHTSQDCPSQAPCVGASVQGFVFTSIGICQ